MLPTTFIERHFQHIQPQLLDIVLELRSLIAQAAPNAVEIIRRKDITYIDEKRGGPVSGGVCLIDMQADHIRLAFIHGAFLPDPQRLLQGNGLYKRFIKLTSFDDAPWDAIKDLITASAHFDPHQLSLHKN